MKEQIMEQISLLESEAREEGRQAGIKEGLEIVVKALKIEKGDVLVLKKDGLTRHQLEALRISTKQLGVAGILSIEEDADIAKLSDINLSLLGLERRK